MKYLDFAFLIVLFFSACSLSGQNGLILSADSLYNLGNQSFNQDDFDNAIYYYEQARLIDPFGEDIRINLKLANENLSTEIIELEPFFLARWWKNVSDIFLPGYWKLMSIFLMTLLLGLVYIYFFKNKPEKQSSFYILLIGILFLFLISILAGNKRYNSIFNSPYAIVIGEDQPLFEGPDTVSEEVKQLTGGNKLRILDEDNDWYKVSALDNEHGWIKKEKVQLLGFKRQK